MTTKSKVPTMEQGEAQQSFQTLVIGHTRLVETRDRIISIIRNPCGASIALLFGSTAVGKTTLLQKILRDHNEQFADLIHQDQSVIPNYYVEVPAPDNGKMNWRDLNIRALEKLNDPHLDNRGTGGNYNGINSADVRRVLEKTIKNRRNSLAIYDEAQHFCRVTGAKSSQQVQDYIKSLASLSGNFIILAGTYELLGLLPRSGQLARRMVPVHLARYHEDVPDDRVAFRQVILTFQQDLPFPDSVLLNSVDFLYCGSLGCVGLLKCWLNRAIALCIQSHSRQITEAHLKATMLPKAALAQIDKEIREGEARVADYDVSGDVFREILKTASSPEQTEDKKEKTGPVFQRKPKRDKVGV